MDLNLLLGMGGGVIVGREHPRALRALSRAVAAGRLSRLVRGIYVAAGARDDPGILVRAVQTAFPNAIFTGLTAAWLNGMVPTAPHELTATHPGRPIRVAGVRISRGRLDDEVWVEKDSGLRVMTQVMTALDVVPALGAKLIDMLVRKARDRGRIAGLHRRFHQALGVTGNRPGNQYRRRLLARTTTNPWSEAERVLHDLLDAAGVSGWLANHQVPVGQSVAILDIAFVDHFLAVEVDGFEFHSSRAAFVSDRRRGNLMVLEGWRLLHFTWDDLMQHPTRVIEQIREALQLCGQPS